MYADVIIPVPLRHLFTYKVPAILQHSVMKGQRVVVSLGNKTYCGIINHTHHKTPDFETREIESILDTEQASVTALQLDFWWWMAGYYMCAIGEVMLAAMPSGLRIESETSIHLIDNANLSAITNKHEKKIINLLQEKGDSNIRKLSTHLEIKNSLSHFKNLIEKEVINAYGRVSEKYKARTETYIKLSITSEKELNTHLDALSKKQQDVLLKLIELVGFKENAHTEVSKKQLLAYENLSPSSLNTLVRKGILEKYPKTVPRHILNYPPATKPLNQLSELQEEKLAEINKQFKQHDTVLLHGITSSGKTEIYMHLIDECLKQQKSVLYLLPEIALTSQITSRLCAFFGEKVLIYHSRLSSNERVEIWKTVQDPSQNHIVIGARSAVFLPFHNLGLIVVDEEHENSFKQFDPAPRYHARDAATFLAKLHQAHTLLGSATPSVETYFNVHIKKYGLVELNTRFNEIHPPEIIIANLADAKRKKKLQYGFTPKLLEEITTTLEKDLQVILFQNRRGYSYFVKCTSCDEIPRCPNCDVSFTLHKYRNLLTCHYCHHTQNYENHICESCGSNEFENIGDGTERIEEQILELFPEYRIGRLDLDASSTKHGYTRILTAFENKNIDILIGTQMLAKGLDFENVGLVGILNADMMLNFPDFRAFERSFQLMTQVSGRAGRKNKQGKVIIQTHKPDHPIIELVKTNDYKALFNSQIHERDTYWYPPVYRMISINIRHKEYKLSQKAANELAIQLKQIFGKRIYGAHDPLVSRINTYYIKQIILKVERKASYKKAKDLLQQEIDKILANKSYSQLRIHCDVDVQ